MRSCSLALRDELLSLEAKGELGQVRAELGLGLAHPDPDPNPSTSTSTNTSSGTGTTVP